MDKTKRDENNSQGKILKVFRKLAIIGSPLILYLLVIWMPRRGGISGADRWFDLVAFDKIFHGILQDHFAAVIGLPLSALLALWVVIILQTKSGPIEISGHGFKFRGASGPVILWILCFLTISFTIKLLW